MDNQHKLIKGYRDLNKDEIEMINKIKEGGVEFEDMFNALSDWDDVDKRCLALAKTNLQQGFMWLIRSIAKPDSFV